MQIRPYGQVGPRLTRRLAQPARAAIGSSDTVSLAVGRSGHAPVPVATAAAAAVGGPVGPTLAERLKELPVEYHLKKWLRLPFCSPTERITPHHAAQALQNVPHRLLVKEGEGDPVPLSSLDDVKELEVFYGLREPFDKLSEVLCDTRLEPYAWQTQVTAYQAYNLAQNGWPEAKVEPQRITLLRQGLPVANLEAGNLVRELATVPSKSQEIDAVQTPEQRLTYVAGYSNDETIAGRLGQAGMGQWAETIQELARDSDLETAARLMTTIGLSDPEFSSKLKVASPFLKDLVSAQKLLDLYTKARQGGASAERASQTLARFSALAVGRNSAALGYAEDLTSDLGSLAVFNDCLERLSGEEAARLHRVLGNSKLQPGDHFRLLERTPAFGKEYGQPLYTRPEAASVFARGLTGVLEAGRSADEAVEVAQRLWAGVSQLDRAGDYLEPAWNEAAKLAADPKSLELYASLVEAKFHPEAAAHLQGVMRATGATSADLKSMQALDLIEGPRPLAFYTVKEKAWTAFANSRRPDALEELQRLGKHLVALKLEAQPAGAAFDYYADHLSSDGRKFEAYMQLLEGGFTPVEAQRTQQRWPQTDLSQVARLGASRAPSEVVDAFLSALEHHPANQELKPLVEAAVGARFESKSLLQLANYFEQAGNEPAVTRTLTRLVGHRLPCDQAIALLEKMQAKAGAKDLEQHLTWLEQAGAFVSDYDHPRYHQAEAPAHLYSALSGMLEAGIPAGEATATIVSCWRTLGNERKWNDLSTACAHLAAMASDRKQLESYQALLSNHFDVPQARRAVERLGRPVKGTDFSLRWQDYQALQLHSGGKPLSYYTVKDACLTAYSGALEAGQERAHTVAQLRQLGQALEGRGANEGQQAFDFYPDLMAHPGHFGTYVTLLKAGFPAERAIQAVGSTFDCDADRLATVLTGLGSRGDHLTPELVDSFLSAFRATNQSPALAPLAETAARQKLEGPTLARVLELYSQRLHSQPHPLGALVALLERGQGPQALPVLAELEANLPAGQLLGRIDQLDQLQAFSKGYSSAGNYATPAQLSSCLDRLAAAGLSPKAQTSTCQAVCQKLVGSGDRREGLPRALQHLGSIAAEPERVEAFQLLLDHDYHASGAAQIESLLAEPGAGLSLSERRSAYEKLGLLEAPSPLSFYAVKMASYRTWRSVAQARDGHTALTQIGKLNQTLLQLKLGSPDAQAAIAGGEKYLLQNDQIFEAYRALLEAGFGVDACQRVLDQAHKVPAATTAAILAPLAKASDRVVAAFQQCAEETASAGHDPATLAFLAAGVGCHEDAEAVSRVSLKLFKARLAEQPELAEAAGRLLQARVGPKAVAEILTVFESNSASPNEQFEALEASGVFHFGSELAPTMAKGLATLLARGHTCSQAGKLLATRWQKVSRYQDAERRDALGYLASSEHEDLFFELRDKHFHSLPAGQFADLLAKPLAGIDLKARLSAFTALTEGSEVGRFYAVKGAAYRLYAKMVTGGGNPDQVPGLVRDLLHRMDKMEPAKAQRLLDTLRQLPNTAGALANLLTLEGAEAMTLALQQLELQAGGGKKLAIEEDLVNIDGFELAVRD
ncbi:MAG: hypothetical protein AB7S38_01820 [Vulcanimicrobiota bacterium]